MMASQENTMPVGVAVHPLTTHRDHRGDFTELFRRMWRTGIDPVQWNFVVNEANVLRGVHVHPLHDDYLVIVSGRAIIGLKDLREGSPTENLATLVELSSRKLEGLFIPHGVAHGFYFPVAGAHLYAVSHYWNMADELGCAWNDPGLALPWPCRTPLLSDRDANKAISLQALRDTLAPYQPIAWEPHP